MSKANDLARLAADERTPEHERAAAALALAKIVARDGLPTSSPPRGTFVSDRDLARQNQALWDILKQNGDQMQALREDKAELERRVAAMRERARVLWVQVRTECGHVGVGMYEASRVADFLKEMGIEEARA